jgi:glycosyltransferase involved in cell wall biosynthesis
LAQFLAKWTPSFCWRWSLTSTYGWEQFSFWLHLWPRLCRGRFDVLHVQDPMVASWCRRFRRLRLVSAKEILVHGTEEPIEFLLQFDYLQHGAPWHLFQADVPESRERVEKGYWVAIPNFADADAFRPVRDSADKAACRRRFGLPEDAFIIGTAAAVKRPHKRIDYLIREFGAYVAQASDTKSSGLSSNGKCSGESARWSSRQNPFLLIAGARTDQTNELIDLAEACAPGRIKVLTDVPREDMPDLLRCLDVFVLTSLLEMMPLAVLEALSTGLPLIANRHPVLQWMVGDEDERSEINGQVSEPLEPDISSDLCGGVCVDLSQEGALVEALAGLTPEWLEERCGGSRRRSEVIFSEEAVVRQYLDYYGRVMGVTAA